MKNWEEEFIEKGANLEHDRWSRWQQYLHNICIRNSDGSITISPERVAHWERQINTSYADLSEKEKEYDRVEVRKYLPLIHQNFIAKEELEEMIEEIIEGMKKTRKISSIIPNSYNYIEGDRNGYFEALSDLLEVIKRK